MNDQTAASNLEITAELAEAAEAILRDFANNAELDVALIVDHSGALIAGISANESIHIDTVSALVAGTIGSIRALGKAVGETKSVESTHHGEDFTIYLRELSARFIVVGVAISDVPAGILREVAARISAPLLKVLTREEIVEKTEDELPFEPEAAVVAPAVAAVEVAKPQFELTDSDSDKPDDTPDEVEDFEVPSSQPTREEDSPSDVTEPEEPPAPEESDIPAAFVDSPFEFVTDDEDDDTDNEIEEVKDLAEEETATEVEDKIEAEAEVKDPTEKMIFEIGKNEDEADITAENHPDEDEQNDDDGVAAPLLVSPAMTKRSETESSQDDTGNDEDDDSNSVEAISVPIATDIGNKIEFSNERNSTPPPLLDDEPKKDEKEEEPELPSGGPRYVFDLG